MFPEDPLNIFEHTKPAANSVLKMFVDLFSTPETASMFYTNDNKVLIDILVRQLSDLSAGDSVSVFFFIYLTITKKFSVKFVKTFHFSLMLYVAFYSCFTGRF